MDFLTLKKDMIFQVGIDPASVLLGVGWIVDGEVLPTLEDHDGNKLQGFKTVRAISKSGRQHRHTRLDDLEEKLGDYLFSFPSTYINVVNVLRKQRGLDPASWSFGNFVIEEASDHYTDPDNPDADRHDTQYVNGLSARMAYTACRRWRDSIREGRQNGSILFVKPDEISENLRIHRRSAKWVRCKQVAMLGGGRYEWDGQPDEKYSGKGECFGGELDGANADALDAVAAAWTAWHYWQDAQRRTMTENPSYGQKSKRRAALK